MSAPEQPQQLALDRLNFTVTVPGFRDLCWSPSGKYLAVLSNERWSIRSWPEGGEVAMQSFKAKNSHMTWVGGDTERLIVATGDTLSSHSAPSFRFNSGMYLSVRGHEISALSASVDGQLLALAAEDQLRVLQESPEESPDILPEARPPIAFGPNGQLAYRAPDGLHIDEYRRVEAEEPGYMRRPIAEPRRVFPDRLTWSEDGMLWAVTDNRVWRIDAQQMDSWGWEREVRDVSVAPRGNLIAVVTETGLVAASFEGRNLSRNFMLIAHNQLGRVAFHPKLPVIAVAGVDGGEGVEVYSTEFLFKEVYEPEHRELKRLEREAPESKRPLPSIQLDPDDLPILVHHLVLSGEARPELLVRPHASEIYTVLVRMLSLAAGRKLTTKAGPVAQQSHTKEIRSEGLERSGGAFNFLDALDPLLDPLLDSWKTAFDAELSELLSEARAAVPPPSPLWVAWMRASQAQLLKRTCAELEKPGTHLLRGSH